MTLKKTNQSLINISLLALVVTETLLQLTGDNDKILELDNGDLFSSMYFNSSIETLADFLILYRDFESEVLQGKDPDDNFQCFNFTDEQFERLKSKMYAVDSRALTERGFWKDELEIMLSIRQEKFARL